MVFEQVHTYYRMYGFVLPACYVFYAEPASARLVLSRLLTASRAIPPTLSSS